MIESWKITIKNDAHENDWRNYLEKMLIIDIIENKLNKLKENYNKKEELYAETLFYWLIWLVSQDYYKEEYELYLKAKDKYEKEKSAYDQKIIVLKNFDTQINNYKWKILVVESYNNSKDIKATEYINVNNKLLASNWNLNNLEKSKSTYQNSIDNYNKDLSNKINTSIKEYKASQDFKEDITSSKYKRWQIAPFKNTDYKNYPYTIYEKYNRTGTWKDYPALVWIEYKINPEEEVVYSTERIIALDKEHKDEVKSFLTGKVKERIELVKKNLNEQVLKSLYLEIQKNIEYLKTNGCLLVSLDINSIPIKPCELTQDELNSINSNLEYFANYLFEYEIKTNPDFKKWFDDEVKKQIQIAQANLDIDWEWLTQEELNQISKDVLKWVKEWTVKATRDYMMQYVDLVNGLVNLSFDDVRNGLKRIWWVVTDPVWSIWKIWNELIEFQKHINNAYDVIVWLWAYEKSFWWTYLWATGWFIAFDPRKKAEALLWKTKIEEIWKKLLETVKTLEKEYRIRILKSFKDLTSTQRTRFYNLIEQYDIRNPLTFIHVNHWEWKIVNVNWKILAQ